MVISVLSATGKNGCMSVTRTELNMLPLASAGSGR